MEIEMLYLRRRLASFCCFADGRRRAQGFAYVGEEPSAPGPAPSHPSVPLYPELATFVDRGWAVAAPPLRKSLHSSGSHQKPHSMRVITESCGSGAAMKKAAY